MAGDPGAISTDEPTGSVELPRPTVAPMVLALGMALLAAGVATNVAFLLVGAVLLIFGLGLWISELIPGRGEVLEAMVAPSRRPLPVTARVGGVGRMQEGMPGSRLRLPTEVHPISAGIKGGLLGGLLMPVPALIWGLWSGHGIWYPVNLLAGLVLPGVGRMTVGELEQFRLPLLLLGLVIHLVSSVTFGLIYGVLMPTLPSLPRPLAWGGLAMPMLWTALTYPLMGLVNPLLSQGVDWSWFIASQFLFGVVAASTIALVRMASPLRAGLVGGLAGGLVMPIPALIWGLLSGDGVWYPANLLAATVLPGLDRLPTAELHAFHPGWLAIAVSLHLAISLGFGALFGLLIPRFRSIPSTLAWGGLLMPLLWTSVSFGLMGVVNPLLQERVSWPWFIASQFAFGIATAIVVERSERIYIPPAGQGPDSLGTFAVGSGGGDS
jgi:uncharacterized membrane protein YagU involved in acid resistance